MKRDAGLVRAALGALASLGLAGCLAGGLAGDSDSLVFEAGFRTDATSYQQQVTRGAPAAVIGVRFANRYGTVVLPVDCTGLAPEWVLERLEGGQWQVAATASCLLASWVPSPIPLGGEYRGSVHLANRVPVGTYRLVFGMLEVAGEATVPVVDGRARSNPFTLKD